MDAPNSRPVLYLHVGTHKTGTTAIQTFATRNRDALLSRRLLYPDYRPVRATMQTAHHLFAHSLAQSGNAPFSETDLRAIVARWHTEALDRNVRVLVSSEAIYRHRIAGRPHQKGYEEYAQRLAEVLEPFEVHVLVVFRRPDDYVRSLYQERVMRAFAPMPEFADFADASSHGPSYHDKVRLYRRHFPIVRCMIYEDLVRSGSLVHGFFGEIGVDVSDLPDSGVVRRSLTAPETIVKNYANLELADRRASVRFVRWMRVFPVRIAIRKSFGGDRYDLWPDHATRERFLDSQAESIRILGEECFDGRREVFPPLASIDTAPPVPSLPDRCRSLVDRHLSRRGATSLRRIVGGVRRRVKRFVRNRFVGKRNDGR